MMLHILSYEHVKSGQPVEIYSVMVIEMLINMMGGESDPKLPFGYIKLDDEVLLFEILFFFAL